MNTTLQNLDSDLCADPDTARNMVRADQEARRKTVNRDHIQAWASIRTRADWEAFVRPRIDALRASLGPFPDPPNPLPVLLGNTLEGDGYGIENLVFESRPGIFVMANLYAPAQPRPAMPGILLVHSHHNPKTQGELQDMGMLWARAGCLVLVMDQFCYGERGQHHSGPRQDYRFRYITGMQLCATGNSLMGFMVWDIHRGVDLLLSRPGIDPQKIIVMGSVAGGGDPAAVAAALDPRIACAVPFNFGGPQPETPYPLPEDAETSFNYMGSGSWESTRNLRQSARDGFLPDVIVGSIAPRRLIYAHEFAWDRDRDPVWQRLQRIYADFYGQPDHLDYTHGFGLLQGRPPQASHCNNIGAPHRVRIYAALERWFGIAPPTEERQERLPDDALRCFTPELKEKLRPQPVHRVLSGIGAARAPRNTPDRRDLQSAWAALLGDIEPAPYRETRHPYGAEPFAVERISLAFQPPIAIPLILCLPTNAPSAVAIGIAQAGKRAFLAHRAGDITALLSSGIAVCLPDVRGAGELAPDGTRTPRGRASSQSATELMFGQTMPGAQLRDLRSVCAYLRHRFPDTPLALWGDSFAPANPPDFADPLMEDSGAPAHSEPLGGFLALFCALFEPDIKAIVARGMITGYQSLLDHVYCYIPHDAVIPGALTAGDLCHIAAALSPMPLRFENLVDGRNCPASPQHIDACFHPAKTAYAKTPEHLCLAPGNQPGIAEWLHRNTTVPH